MILPYRPDAHSVSDSLDDAWNGIVGKIELRARRRCGLRMCRFSRNRIEKRACHGFKSATKPATNRSSTIRYLTDVHFRKPSQSKATGRRQIFKWTLEQPEVTFETEVTLPFQKLKRGMNSIRNFRCSPTVLKADRYTNMQTKIFGLRDFHADGNQFILNGRPMYFRGTHFGGDFPLTGYPPTDVESWKKIFQTCKDCGLEPHAVSFVVSARSGI